MDNELAGIQSHPAIQNQSELNNELNIQIDDVLLNTSQGKQSKNIKYKIAVQDAGKDSYSVKDKADELRQQCIQNAQKLTDLNKEMETIKNLYENKLLIEFTKKHINQEKIEHLIKEYMQARFNDCMLKQQFAQAMKTENKHIYLKVLRQRVLEEMKLTESMNIDEMSWSQSEENSHIAQKRQYFTDSLYNLNQINNDQAIGYNNIIERASDLQNNQNIAHQSVFDKLLADYFLQSRSKHKKGNQLVKDLEEIFGNFTSPSQSGEKARKSDEKSQLEGQTGNHSLGLQYQLQAANKDDQPFLPMYNFKALMDLDITINRYLYDGKSGLSQQLRNKPDEIQLIPDFYDFYDVRMPADLYVTKKLEIILEQLFEARRKIEKYLSRQELIAYDQSMLKYLSKQSLMDKLRRDLYKDYNQIELMEQSLNHLRISEQSTEAQLMKTKNEQPQFNKDVVNEDAYYKFLAYTGNLEKQRRDNHKQTINNPELLGGEQNFEQFYQKQLLDSAKQNPRPINSEDYVPKRKKITEELYLKEKTVGEEDNLGYMSRIQKQEKFFDDHSLYLENQLEQKERIELFFVLQKFFESQGQIKGSHQDDPLYVAQESIKEYFSKPENTNFFEKNKIY